MNDRRTPTGLPVQRVIGALASTLLFLIACQDRPEADVDTTLQEARELIGDRRFGEGLAKMRALVEANPDDARLQALYGEALLASGQPSLAVWPLSRAMGDPEQLVHAGLLLAQAQTLTGSGIDAIRTTTRVLEADPENEEALLLRVRAQLGESLEERALEDLDRAEDLGIDQATVDLLRLDALLGLGKEKEAEALLAELTAEAEQMKEEDPAKAARLCAATATFTYERGDIEGAKDRFDACLAGDGVRHSILTRAAIDFFDKAGEIDRATDVFKRRFELDPKRLETRVAYADRLQRTGETAKGEALLLEVTEEQPAAWTALVDLYAIGGDVRKAVEALDRAIAANPNRREDWLFSRADFLLALGEVDEAEKTLESIEVPAHRALLQARIAMSRGALETAAEHFEEGIRLWPDNPDARYLAAQTYERLGEWKKAAAHYREAARMDPPHYRSSLALADLQRALGDMEGVSFLLLRLADEHPSNAKVLEKIVQFASDSGSAELGMRTLNRLSRLPGQAGRAVALAADRIQKTEGAEAALAAIEKTGLDLADPANVEALDAAVRQWIALDRGAAALEAVDRALAKSPDSPRLLVLRARVQRGSEAPERARVELERALALDGEYLPALLELAEIHLASGRRDEARAVYARAVPIERAQADPDEPVEAKAALALARLELEAGEREAARGRLREVLDANPRLGSAAWLLLQTYADDGSGLPDAERRELALRASVFERSPQALDYWKKLNAERS